MSKKRKLYFIGDIHGEFHHLAKVLLYNKIENADVVCCGDIGIGFKGWDSCFYREDVIKDFTKIKELGVKIHCLRGNHDNPIYFSGKTLPFDCIDCKLYEDYSIVCFDKANVIFIGGGFSSDIKYRLEINSKKNPVYWDDEMPVFTHSHKIHLESKLEDVFEFGFKKPLIIASHSAPIFCYPHQKWGGTIVDNFIIEQNDKERSVMGRIYYTIKDKINQISKHQNAKSKKINWYYGHFHVRTPNQKFNGDLFHGLGILNIVEYK